MPHPPPTPHARYAYAAALLCCLVVALVTRWLFLARESLWLDEGWSWWVASLPPGKRLSAIRADVVAPAYFYALGGWTRAFGDHESALRSLSALFATLTLLPFAAMARRVLVSKRAMLAAAALMGVSFMQSQYAREARPYALLCLATLAALTCVPTLATNRSWPAMLGFASCVIGGLYTHNVMPFYAASLAVAWLIWPGERSRRARCADLAIVIAICAVAYAPWVPSMLEQRRWMTGHFWAARPDAFAAGRALAAVAGVDVYAVPPLTWTLTGVSIPAGWVAAFVSGAIFCSTSVPLVLRGSASKKKSEMPMVRPERILLALMTVSFAPMLLIFLLSRLAQPIFIERVFVPSSAIVPLILAYSLDLRSNRVAALVGSVVAIAIGALGITSTYAVLTTPQKEDWRSAYTYVASLPPSPGRLIVFVAAEGELPFAYYASQDPKRHPEPRTGVPGGFFDLDPPRTIRRVKSDDDLSALRDRLLESPIYDIVLILGHEDFSDSDGRVERWLREHAQVVDEQKPLRLRIMRFTSKQS